MLPVSEVSRPWAPRGYAALVGSVGGHSIDLVENELITKLLRYLAAPGLPCNHRGVNLLGFTLLPNC